VLLLVVVVWQGAWLGRREGSKQEQHVGQVMEQQQGLEMVRRAGVVQLCLLEVVHLE
jgi:hypothetical protein